MLALFVSREIVAPSDRGCTNAVQALGLRGGSTGGVNAAEDESESEQGEGMQGDGDEWLDEYFPQESRVEWCVQRC